jgi:hypothetical protein
MLHNNLQTTLGADVDRLEAHRHFYADLVTASAGAAKNERLKDAFASTPRELFVAPVHGKYLPGAITSRLLATTLHSCIKTSSWLLRPNAESTTASLFFTQLILRRAM